MHSFEHRMNFESEQAAKLESAEFNRLVARKLDELGEPWSIEKSVAAVNWASEQIDPEGDELVYELDEEQGL